jgi:hypothetical protein
MATPSADMILSIITTQRFALNELRKDILLSRTDIEILAFAKRKQMFTVYEVKQYYHQTNIQQLREGIIRLESNYLLDLIKRGRKNKPSVYWLTNKGGEIIDKYISLLT